MGIIYCATSSTTGKRYVGQTIRPLRARIQSHEHNARKGSGLHFHAALRKYGFSDFRWEVLEISPVELLDDAETKWIAHFDSSNRDAGYNTAIYGGHAVTRGRKLGPHSEEHRRRISEAHKGKKHSDEHMRKLWAGRAKWKPNAEQREAIGRSNRGRKHTDEARRNMSLAQCGRVFSEEHRKHLSEAHLGQTGRTPSAEMKQAISEKLKGHPVSEETRRRIRDSLARHRSETSTATLGA